MTDFSCNCL